MKNLGLWAFAAGMLFLCGCSDTSLQNIGWYVIHSPYTQKCYEMYVGKENNVVVSGIGAEVPCDMAHSTIKPFSYFKWGAGGG